MIIFNLSRTESAIENSLKDSYTETRENNFHTETNSDKNNHYYIAGQLTALGIVHCGFGLRCFSQLLFSLLVESPENIHPTLDDLTEQDIKNEICMAMDACDLQALRNIVYEGTFIRLAGWEQISVLEKKDIMIK
ncbi:unnamed protein product [Brassicogethes aeneus]|uniref:HECT domain-containing protein n=1 Tax=Brassicogethes aeneus TaxID=1431903 RepID=A0A9P0BHF7_BRAAE|nr:unnamed protein product [Brassicogethes aeneus]